MVTWITVLYMKSFAGRMLQYINLCRNGTTWLFLTGLWNEIFLFSNISIFILLPFAYLFTESEGLPGSRKVSRNAIQPRLPSKVLRSLWLWQDVDTTLQIFYISLPKSRRDREIKLLIIDWVFSVPLTEQERFKTLAKNVIDDQKYAHTSIHISKFVRKIYQ